MLITNRYSKSIRVDTAMNFKTLYEVYETLAMLPVSPEK